MVEKANVMVANATNSFPQYPGSPKVNAWIVKATPVSPDVHTPVELIAIAVMEHTIKVSIKVPVIDTNACLHG